MQGLSNEIFKQHLDTEKSSIQSVAEDIAKLSSVNLLPDNSSKTT